MLEFTKGKNPSEKNSHRDLILHIIVNADFSTSNLIWHNHITFQRSLEIGQRFNMEANVEQEQPQLQEAEIDADAGSSTSNLENDETLQLQEDRRIDNLEEQEYDPDTDTDSESEASGNEVNTSMLIC